MDGWLATTQRRRGDAPHGAAAAALATLDILRDRDVPGHVARVSVPFQQRLRGLVQRHAFVGDVRGHGLMLGIEMVADQARRTPLPKTSDIPSRVARAAYARGLMVRVSGPNLILSPPLVITPAELAAMLKADTERWGPIVKSIGFTAES